MANIQRYLTKGKTGQIIIKFKGVSHLCKLYVEDGEIIYISCGRMSIDEILNGMATAEIETINFIEGIRAPKRLEAPITSIVVEKLGGAPVASEIASQPTIKEEEVNSLKVETLIEDFIDIIGPLGTVIVENTLKDLGYARGQSMDGLSYVRLLETLVNELPEDKRQSFKAKHS